MTELKLFNSMTRTLEPFKPLHDGEARVYTCGPTVYNYQHIGNMRAYIFADTLGRVLSYKGYDLTHVINITDVGHLTSDADAGDDKMEKAASAAGKSAWDIAAFYQADFEADLARLNIRKVQHPRATEYVEAMIAWGTSIADKHCYELESGLYFDTSTVAEYGRLARAATEDGANGLGARIDAVDGKRHAADFAIWRKTPADETRQMEWDSPWGKGAPGWHLECSVMSKELLGHPFDIHTGGIDHREIHHPNEIAQNQAHGGCDHSGARTWMHNNFLIDRSGKMSKSSGEFLRLQLLIDKGFHPLAYRLMCLQAHYRSELEFSWEGLQAALVRLKRMVMGIEKLRSEISPLAKPPEIAGSNASFFLDEFEMAISEDLNTSEALTIFERVITTPTIAENYRWQLLLKMDQVLGLNIKWLDRVDLRIRPTNSQINEDKIAAIILSRLNARQLRDFAKSDAIRDDLIAKGVEVMDGDPLGWDWKLDV
jgi:cysteinyl-tRNA synthetase